MADTTPVNGDTSVNGPLSVNGRCGQGRCENTIHINNKIFLVHIIVFSFLFIVFSFVHNQSHRSMSTQDGRILRGDM
ncbi:uncharacterized protein HKW66_Vig0038560 [Vigna angularis]|uniref:Uncharacterized protein n=1 Tax=Phaseolus angularis TaxID=3914 RepID=A0A8T0LAN0_PHAAN|nr:uncharacterized protein HKW66_Vig0038560 [Vigna angularis]